MDIGQFLLAYSHSFVSIMTSPFIENSILDEFRLPWLRVRTGYPTSLSLDYFVSRLFMV